MILRHICYLLLALSMLSCGPPSSDAFLQAKDWKGRLIQVETRPAPVDYGRVEFLLMGTNKDGSAVHDMVAFIRLEPGQAWKQVIQDGYTGVYRRSLSVRPRHDKLFLKLKNKGEQVEFFLDLFPAGKP